MGGIETTGDLSKDIIGTWQTYNSENESETYWFVFSDDGSFTFGTASATAVDGTVTTTSEYKGTYSVSGNTVDLQFADGPEGYSGKSTVSMFNPGFFRWTSGPMADIEGMDDYMEQVDELNPSRRYQDEKGIIYLVIDNEASIIGFTGSAELLEIPENISFSVADKDFSASVTRVEDDAFKGSQISSVYIPASIEYIGNNAFAGSALSSVQFEDRSDELNFGYNAFKDCVNITAFEFPRWMRSLSPGFLAGTGIETIRVPSTVKSTYYYSEDASGTFQDCKSLKSVDLSASGLDMISNQLFEGCTSLETVKFPALLDSINSRAFAGCTALKAIEFPSSLDYIGESAFEGAGLTEVTVPSTVLEMSYSIFKNCKNLVSAEVNAKEEFIGESLFEGCTSLTEASFSSYARYIRSYVFKGCSSLKTVVFEECPIEIDSEVFSGCTSLESVTLPASIEDFDYTTFDGYDGDIKFAEGSEYSWIEGSGNSFLSDYGTTLFIWDEEITDIVVPEGVTRLGDSVFFTQVIDSISFPSTLTTIGEEAFRNAYFDSIVLPEGVTTIENEAFSGCNNLISITIPASLTYAGNDVFIDCYNLQNITYGGTIEEWKALGFAFRGCNYPISVKCTDGTITENQQ